MMEIDGGVVAPGQDEVADTDPVSAHACHCRCVCVEALVVDALVEHVGHFGRVTYQ